MTKACWWKLHFGSVILRLEARDKILLRLEAWDSVISSIPGWQWWPKGWFDRGCRRVRNRNLGPRPRARNRQSHLNRLHGTEKWQWKPTRYCALEHWETSSRTYLPGWQRQRLQIFQRRWCCSDQCWKLAVAGDQSELSPGRLGSGIWEEN